MALVKEKCDSHLLESFEYISNLIDKGELIETSYLNFESIFE